MKKLEIALCEGRHEMPVKRAIFSSTINPLDTKELEKIASKKLYELQKENKEFDSPVYVYVTGITVACVAVIQACVMDGISLTLMHYNKETGEYYPQEFHFWGLGIDNHAEWR